MKTWPRSRILVVLKRASASEPPGELVKAQLSSPTASDSVSLGWGPKICISFFFFF